MSESVTMVSIPENVARGAAIMLQKAIHPHATIEAVNSLVKAIVDCIPKEATNGEQSG